MDNTKKPIWSFDKLTVEQIFNQKNQGIIQDGFNRPSSVSDDGNEKNVGIIKSIMEKTLGTPLIFRDIDSPKYKIIKRQYGDVTQFLLIDGGHRIRAIIWYVNNQFSVNGKFFKDLTKKERLEFLNTEIAIHKVICNSQQATEIFRAVNKIKVVKPYSVIMTNEDSEICKFVRQQTKNWSIYNTDCHSIFGIEDGKAKCWNNKKVPNKDNIWDNLVFVILHKIIGKGNVDAGEKTTYELLHA